MTMMMKCFSVQRAFLLGFLLGAYLAQAAQEDLVLSEKIMTLSKLAAQLSTLAYAVNPPGDAYDTFGYYDAEPDQALVAKKNGYCYVAFRGTTLTWNDWKQNLVVGSTVVCSPTDATDCCTTRRGFYQAYDTSYRAALEASVRKCAKDCLNKDECVVITGHSQGGAIAAVAGLVMNDLNPYVITFGQPPTVMPPCAKISSARWYRYVNTKSDEKLRGLFYDPVPFAPGLGAQDYGHMIVLGDDNTGVAYLGLDVQDYLTPLDVDGFDAHWMIALNGSHYPGYLDRINSIIQVYSNASYSYPVRDDGYVAGSLCTRNKECQTKTCTKETAFTYSRCVGKNCDKDSDCDTGRCDSGICLPKLGSCMVCDESSDCLYNHCSWSFRCSGPSGLLDNDCSCNLNWDCQSGRCEGLKPSICEARLGLGAFCDESSDCLSNKCSWRFQCVDQSSKWLMHSAMMQEASLDADTLEEQGVTSINKNKKALIGFSVAVGGLFVAFVASFIYRCTSRRRGYQAIPTQLSV